MRFTSTFVPALALMLFAGCADRSVSELEPDQGRVESTTFPPTPDRDIDILFVIDNSGSMAEEQTSLRANFTKFMDVLSTLDGGMPNVHIGVVTSSLGQSAADGVGGGSFGAGCAGTGDDGVLRTAPAITGRFIIDEANATGRTRNYTGTLGDAFSAIADVGTMGCGIEQHLGAAERALSNPTNAGFLRPDAKLAVIFIGDEDDCSLEHKALFEGSTDGTVVNFRCTSAGIECDGGSDLSVPGLRTNCHAKSDSPYLSDVDRYVEFLKSLKAEPDLDIIVAGIVGNPDPVEITQDTMGRSVLEPSCVYAGQNAYPAVRTADFLSQFRYNVRETICEADLSSALVEVGALVAQNLDPRCLQSTLADRDLSTPGLQPDCTVSDYQRMPDGSYQETYVLPECGQTTSAAPLPCWHIEENKEDCAFTPTQLEMVVERGETIPPAGTRSRASCVTIDGSVR